MIEDESKVPDDGVERYLRLVTVIMVAEQEAAHGEPLPANATFLLHTMGMREHYARPELEIAGVPALWLVAAAEMLNGWAVYSIAEKQIHAGETLADGYRGSVKLRAFYSPGECWKRRDECLRLVVEAVRQNCDYCNAKGGA